MPDFKIHFFNTLRRNSPNDSPIDARQEFIPLRNDKKIGLYTCGPTVYDFAHIGNFRAFVFEDLLRRFLESQGFEVNHVMNLTDVDDKTIAGANQNLSNIKDPLERLNQYTAKYIQAFNEDLIKLNCRLPKKQPRATDRISSMKNLIEKLVRKGIAYEVDGSVYYRVSKFPAYGKLSGKNIDLNIGGASERIDIDEYDREKVTDFALWKKSKPDEPSWDSLWGKGRPGWHIECSAMSMEELGEQFDIHAGGEDLIFPHHENEIAQSEGATGVEPFVKYWLHCKFLLVDGEKMSKSKGNFYTLRDLLAKGYDPMAIRYTLLSSHYRSSLNFTIEGLKESAESIRKLDDIYYQCLSRLHLACFNNEDFGYVSISEQILKNISKHLGDDLNIAAALSALLSALSQINIAIPKMSEKELKEYISFFKEIDKIFGFDIAAVETIESSVIERVKQLQEFRKNKDFAQADKIRAELKAEGWAVKDGKPGEPSTVKKLRRTWDKF